jgi:formylglycine-generating enzyme required for sulfatase activity
MTNWKKYILVVAAVATAAGFGYIMSSHRNIPSDLRDAVADKGFDASILSFEKGAGNIPEPKAAAVKGINKGYVKPVEPATPIEWVSISGGKFTMRPTSIEEGFAAAKPLREVTIETFEMSKTAVTVAQYAECMIKGKGACTEPATGDYCNWGKPGRGNHPVNCVDWNQAKQYAKFKGARLPSEAEWEYAATSGGRNQKYPWGDKLDSELAVLNTNSTMPVCSKPGGNTAQGLCDMFGNVWQWVEDTYQNSYAGAPVGGSAFEGAGSARVVRGASFSSFDVRLLRGDNRGGDVPGFRHLSLGFRLAR